ncbi:PH domain-containing protein [Lysinibacillus sp. 54212]|uniref:PH domain-containing protein n=1 Tax=Lysinibacillus sp. 54212 TaxID=3119829 RepID=UPI002FC947C0
MGILIWSLVGVLLWVFCLSVVIQIDVIGLIVSVIIICFVVWIWFDTGYSIENNQLKTSYGPIKRTISIQHIQSIRYTTNPFVAPALSMKRIEINYNTYETIQVSPKDRRHFIEALLLENPLIKINS